MVRRWRGGCQVEEVQVQEMRSVALTLAIALHASLAAVALVRCTETQKQEPPPPPQGAGEVDVKLIPSSDDESDVYCADFYRGIGIRRNFGNYQIFEVVAGGPADKAGISVGDEILNDDVLGPNRYMVGHEITLHIRRDGREFPVQVRIGRICTE
jgi:predicted metalloprotease with PDZ domain